MRKNYRFRVHGICTLFLTLMLGSMGLMAKTPAFTGEGTNTGQAKPLAGGTAVNAFTKNSFTGNDPATILKKETANGGKHLSFIENKGQITDQNYKQRKDIQFSLRAANGLNIFVGNGEIHYQFNKNDNPEEEKSKTQNPQQAPNPNCKTSATAPVCVFILVLRFCACLRFGA